MSYKHILVAVDLTNESRQLVEKAANLAKVIDAELSFIYVDLNNKSGQSEQIVAEELAGENRHLVKKEAQELLRDLADNAAHPVKYTLMGSGNINDELDNAIKQYGIDLILCGHHQDFWHTFMSSAKKVINSIPVDILIVPFR